MSGMRVVFTIFLVGLIAVGAGCAFTKMETAHQLDAGEVVVSGSAHWPGALFFIPKIQGNVMYGFGPGDVSAHMGTAFLLYNGGVGGRLYLSDFLTLSLQGDAMFMLPGTVPFDSSGDSSIGIFSIVPRLTTAAEEGRPFYAGLQSSILFPFWYTSAGGWEGRAFGGLGGLIFGGDFRVAGNSGFQVEMILYPLAFNENAGVSSAVGVDGALGIPMLGEASIGGYLRPTAEDRRERRIEPSEEWHDEPPPRRDEPRQWGDEDQSEEERVPEYDERGVPVY